MTTASLDASTEMTPEQQGVFYELFKNAQLPDWFINSSPAQREVLRDLLIKNFASRDRARKVMAKLEAPEKFVSARLTKAVSEKLKESIDLTGAVFQHVRSTSSLLGLRKKLIHPVSRDLIAAACENFTANETAAASYHERSLIYLPERIAGRGNRILPIEPNEFAQLCRDLDLGKRYLEHLEHVLEKDLIAQETCIAHSRSNFALDTVLARMKGDISESTFQHLNLMLKRSEEGGLTQDTVSVHTLKLLECTVFGVLFFQFRNDDERCVLYLPGHPDWPIKEYASFVQMEIGLSKHLRRPSFVEYFVKSIALGDSIEFRKQLKDRLLEPSGGSPLPKDSILLPLTAVDVEGDVFGALFDHRFTLVKKTARLLIVPTDDEDENERLARLDTYKTVAIDLVLFAASFVPGIGEILMAVTAFQLLKGVYLGLSSWAQGDQEQATEYFFDTTENLVIALALMAGQKGITATYRTIKGSGFVNRLRQIQLPDGVTRLWNPDLQPYRQNISLPDWLEPDEKGLHWLNEQAYVRLGSSVYAVREQTGTEMWEVQRPPSIAQEDYAPLLETNSRGAWRHDSELPQEWDRLTLFRRLGYSESLLNDVQALQVLTASAVQEGMMREAILNRTTPPGVLIDTAQRFSADLFVGRFIEQMRIPQTAVYADIELQLYLLTNLGTWPANTSLSITNVTGQTLKSFPIDGVAGRHIKLRQESIGKGKAYTDVLGALTERERARLLSTGSSAVDPEEVLRELLLERAIVNNCVLFERVYQRNSPPLNDVTAVLVNKYSKLPSSIAEELVWYSDSHEVLELQADNVPLRLAEEARRYLQVLRENRAFEGLYLNTAGATDTNRLVLDALEHLPGWKGGLYVEILDGTVTEDSMASIGTERAEEHLLVMAHSSHYGVWNKQSEQIAYLTGRTRESYFQALWQGLSLERRLALGVESADGAAILREKITLMALRRREFANLVLSNASVRVGYTSPMHLADRLQQVSPIEDGVIEGGNSGATALQQRARELYPTYTIDQISTFLNHLGTDEALALRRLELLRIEFSNLRDTLQRWIERDTWHQGAEGPRIKVTRLAKFRAAMQIIRGWRGETPQLLTAQGHLSELTMPPLVVGELPMLVGDFSHVGALSIQGAGISAGISRFLSRFTNLRVLVLSGNELERLPAAIGEMKQLENLELNDNRIHLTTQSLAQLASMRTLKRLELSFNAGLGRAPDVSQLASLEYLGLRGTGISEWPVGTTGLPKLRALDLRDNRIVHIPQHVLFSSDLLNIGTDIRGNPLSPESIARLADYQLLNEASLGLISARPSDLVARVLVDISMSSIWLKGVSGELRLSRQQLWRSVFLIPNSKQFFTLLIRMRESVDFRLTFTTLREKVWSIIEAVAEDSALRRSLFRMAQADARSLDDCSLLFSDLTVTVLCFRAMSAARSGAASLERQFVRLLRSLFRLRMVETIAHRYIVARQRLETFTADQAMQVSFVFRMGLAQRLDLLGQPATVNQRLDVEVSTQTLNDAYDQVIQGEEGTALRDSLKAQPFWVDYMQRAYSEQFDEIELGTKLALLALDRQTTLSKGQYLARMSAIVSNNSNARSFLLTRLTQAALERFDSAQALVNVPTFASTD